MTSYTKALYRKDPKAHSNLQEHILRYGRHVTLAQFVADRDMTDRNVIAAGNPAFGRRVRVPGSDEGRTYMACEQLCGHPACAQGCTGRR